MTAMRLTLPATLLACAALAAGCGSSSSSSTTTATTATTASTSAPASGANAAAVGQYVQECKSIVEREPSLSASVKQKVEGICNKAADGDVEGARKAAREVCVEIINASPIPSASLKKQAVEACEGSH